jgi:Flp pilus assembly protein TadD
MIMLAPKKRSASRIASAGLGVIMLSACASSGQKGDIVGYGKGADYKDAIGVYTNPGADADPSMMDPIAAAAFWGTTYDRAPQVAANAVRYAAALRKIGSSKEAVSVMSKAVARFPTDADVNLEYGKALVEEGRAFEAIRHLEIAADARRSDWRALSAYAVALDHIGEHALARAKYDEALGLSPNNPGILNNKALSYALDGDLKQAVRTLRAATANRGADARVRQNLALVLAIDGDMREAERLARSDLPPQVADQNIAFFRQIATQPAFWQDYAAGAAAPKFDAPRAQPAAKPAAQPAAQPAAKPAAQPKPAVPGPSSAPTLKEEPKQENKDAGKPIALKPATKPTAASAVRVEETAPAAAKDAKSAAPAPQSAPDLKR